MLTHGAFLVASIAGTLGLLLVSPAAAPDTTFPLLLLSVVPLVALVVAQRRADVLPTWAVLVPSAFLVVIAVIAEPHGSHDVWSYAAYGRILAKHHANPYLSPPSAFAHDVVMTRVAHGWQGTRSVYGPGFTLLSAMIMAVVGSSAAAARIAFQATAGVAVLGSLALLARNGVRSIGLAPIALNPLLIVWVLNGGHNDALVGLALLAAVLAIGRDRPVLAGGCIGAALMVKAIAALPLVALGIWIWRRRGAPVAARFGAVATVPVLIGYALFGGYGAVRPLLASSGHVSRSSVWRLILDVVPHSASAAALRHVGLLAGGLVLLVTAAALVRPLRDGPPSAVVASSVLGYLVAGAFVLPWYLAWALPVAALEARSTRTVLFLVESCALLVAYQYQVRPTRNLLDHALSISVYVVAALFLATCVALVATGARAVRRPIAEPAG